MKNQLVRLAKQIVERFPKLAFTCRYVRDGWQLSGQPQDTVLGFKLMGNPVMQNGYFEPEETGLIKKIISQVDVVINVGANIGYYCCIALSQGKQVVAFEPLPLNLQYLLRNIKANKWESKIEVFPLALSNKVGLLEIYGGGTGASLVKGWAGIPESFVTLVPSSTFDNIVGSRFHGRRCFVLVDIEGAEQWMLEGATAFLEMEPKPIWMVEITISEHQPKGVRTNPTLRSTFETFWKNGYEARTADTQCRVIHSEEIDKIVRTGVDTLQTHNFLFVEPGKKNGWLDV